MIVQNGVPLAPFTTLGIGGTAETLLIPENRGDIALAAAGMPIVLGGGSNVLIRGGRIERRVLKIGGRFGQIRVEDCTIAAQAGAPLARAARLAAENGLTGLEWAAHIPGTVGGAAAGNAGAHGGCFADTAECVTVWRDGEFVDLTAEECGFSYRNSTLARNGQIVTDVLFRLKKGDKARIMRLIALYGAVRRARQPAGRSAGSVFKAAADGTPAGVLIDRAGLKGARAGGAYVSELHANFILNDGSAVFGDVKALIERVRAAVADKYGVWLETEIKLIE
jgi:UDP-N-acetylmuramate dehydrogenase